MEQTEWVRRRMMQGEYEDIAPRSGHTRPGEPCQLQGPQKLIQEIAQEVANEHGAAIVWGPADRWGPLVCPSCKWTLSVPAAKCARQRKNLHTVAPPCGTELARRVIAVEREGLEEWVRRQPDAQGSHKWRMGPYTAVCTECGWMLEGRPVASKSVEVCHGVPQSGRRQVSESGKMRSLFRELANVDEWVARRNPEQGRWRAVQPNRPAARSSEWVVNAAWLPVQHTHPVRAVTRTDGRLECAECKKRAPGTSVKQERSWWWQVRCT